MKLATLGAFRVRNELGNDKPTQKPGPMSVLFQLRGQPRLGQNQGVGSLAYLRKLARTSGHYR